MWNAEQCYRLAYEKKLIEKYMPGFQFHDPKGDTYILGWAATNDGGRYQVRVDLPGNYPYSAPRVYIVSPKTLQKHGGGNINSEGTTHCFHTLSNGHEGCVQICHFSGWDASTTCVKVLMKTHAWLEAYAGHLRTGKVIADFLRR